MPKKKEVRKDRPGQDYKLLQTRGEARPDFDTVSEVERYGKATAKQKKEIENRKRREHRERCQQPGCNNDSVFFTEGTRGWCNGHAPDECFDSDIDSTVYEPVSSERGRINREYTRTFSQDLKLLGYALLGLSVLLLLHKVLVR